MPPNNLKVAGMWFAGFTLGNVASTALSIGEFSYESAPIRAGIATTLLYSIGKIATRR